MSLDELIADIKTRVYHAARNGNLNQLKAYLYTWRSEEERNVLVSGNVGGTTPLVIACRNGHYDVAEYLIENCRADIELPGSVIFDGETIEGVPPLWCAAAAGHLPLVQLLVRAGARVNSTTRTHSTPLRAACFDGHYDIVKYLVENGADIEIANRHGHTCLMIACYKGHNRIARYLLSLNANVNRKSVKGNTALHDCAESGSLFILKMLLAHGATMDVDSYGMTPLLAASVTGHTHIVEHLIGLEPGVVSRRQRIDALELLGATYVDKRRDMVGALALWKRAMDERFPSDGCESIPKPKGAPPLEAYDFTVEASDSRELDELLADPDAMRMQALVIRERILGPAHPDTSYYVRYRGAVYADAGRFARCRQLWHHALDMQRSMLPPLSPMTHSSLYSFAELFSYMLSERARPPARGRVVPPVTFDDINPVLTKALVEMHRGAVALESRASLDREQTLSTLQRVLVISLHLAALLVRLLDEPGCSARGTRDIHEAVQRLVKLDVKVKKGRSALHVAVSEGSRSGVESGGTLPGHGDVQPCCRGLVALMLRLGAKPDARDTDGNTPLHLVSMLDPCPADVFRELLSRGAHIDMVNYNGQTPADILKEANQNIWSIVNPLHYTTLKCLAAKTIKNYRIPYRNNIPACLYSTVITH